MAPKTTVCSADSSNVFILCKDTPKAPKDYKRLACVWNVPSGGSEEAKQQLTTINDEDKMLNEKASNGLSYREAKKIMTDLYKKFRNEAHSPHLPIENLRKYFVHDKAKSNETGLYALAPNRGTLEKNPEYVRAKAACAELEAKYPKISGIYERREGLWLKVRSGLGFAEQV